MNANSGLAVATVRKRVLFAWEAGANLGHVMPLARLARRFAESGIECLFAVRDLKSASLALAGLGIKFVQAPVWPWHDHTGNEDGSGGYLDVLASLGFGDPEKLTAMLQGWSGLLDLIRPDLIVADHSPALCALARARGDAVVAVGNGFTLPPVDHPIFPPIRADRAPLLPESRLLHSLGVSLSTLNMRSPASLVDGLATDERIVFSFPELDCYQGWRNEALHLPIEPLPAIVQPPDVPHLFVYVGAELPGLIELVQVLGDFPWPVECYLRDVPPTLLSFLRMRGVVVHDTPPDLATLLPQVSHVLSQGGMGMCHMAMAAGRPHIIMSLHGETELNYSRLSALGIARSISPGLKAVELKNALVAILQDHELIARAMQWGALIAQRSQPPGDEAVTSSIYRLLALNHLAAQPD